MHRKTLLMAGLISGLALTPAISAAGPSISTQAAPGVNFGAYRTYGWVSALPPAGMNPVMYQQIMADIDQALAQKGYQKAESGDLSLILTIGAQQKTDVETWGRFGLQTSVYQYTQGQLSLDAFDARTKQALWHWQAKQTVNPDKPNPSKVSKAIDKLMAQFPATAVPVAAPAPTQ